LPLQAEESWLLPGTKVTILGTVISRPWDPTSNDNTINPAEKEMVGMMEGITVNEKNIADICPQMSKEKGKEWKKFETRCLVKLVAKKAIIVSLDSKDFRLAKSNVQVLPGSAAPASSGGQSLTPWWCRENAALPPQNLMFNIVVPPNVVGGKTMTVNLNGQTMQVQVPYGISSGQSFQVTLAQPILTPDSIRNWDATPVDFNSNVDLSLHNTKQKKKHKKKKKKKKKKQDNESGVI